MSGHAVAIDRYLERAKAALESGKQTPGARAAMRLHVRKRCAAERIAVPEWASASAPTETKPVKPERRPLQVRRPLQLRRKSVALAAPSPAEPVTLPAELSAWRQARPGACVHVGAAGVVLDSLEEGRRRFPSVEAALAAIGG